MTITKNCTNTTKRSPHKPTAQSKKHTAQSLRTKQDTDRTKIVRKRVGPDWRPTANMLKRNPDWPKYIPAGPDNPLGTHAMYLTWKYYRIHGTHDTRKIGRRSSSGCIGLFNEHIEELFNLSKVGTQVLLI